jgi:hypothetical protein
MKTNAPRNVRFMAITLALLVVATVPAAKAGSPQYQIYDIGVIDAGDDASQGFGVSHDGIAVGRSIRTGVYLDAEGRDRRIAESCRT